MRNPVNGSETDVKVLVAIAIVCENGYYKTSNKISQYNMNIVFGD